jgi:hypothetical protein
VPLEGVPLPAAGLGGTDTIVRRPLGDPFGPNDPPGSTMIPIEIVALSLTSVAPITVNHQDGSTTQWTVDVELSSSPPLGPGGQMQVVKDSPDGGTFTATLPVQPKFTFTNVANPGDVRVLDTGLLPPLGQLPPVVLEIPTTPWSHQANGAEIVIDPGTLFVPGVIPVAQQSVPFTGNSNPPGVTHTVCNATRKQCLYEVTCVTGNCPGCPLVGELYSGPFCVNTCPVSFSQTCGATGCCVTYTLVGCVLTSAPPSPPGSACAPPANTCCCTDFTGPVITCPADITVQCGIGAADPGETGIATAVDAGCGMGMIIYSDSVAPGNCPVGDTYQVITRTWTATDVCGNSSTCEQIITVQDTTPPEFVDCDDETTTLPCNPASVPDCDSFDVEAVDSCSSAVVTCGSADSSTGCDHTRVITFTATDACGNQATCTKTYHWREDTTPPVLANLPTGGSLPCNSPPVCDPGVTATDTCDGAVGVLCTPQPIDINGCQRSQIIRYTAVDSCGNVGVANISYTWTEDTQDPVAHNCPAGPIDLGCNPSVLPTCATAAGIMFLPAPLLFTDNCGPVDLTCDDGGVIENGCDRSQTFTYTATDVCGGTAVCAITYIWTEDNVAPVITCPADFSVTAPPGACSAVVTYVATAEDDCDGAIAPSCTIPSGTLVAAGTHVVTCTATDGCGNDASCTFNVTVVENCDDGDPCTIDTCESGTCLHTPGENVTITISIPGMDAVTVSRCIHFEFYTCPSSLPTLVDQVVSFTNGSGTAVVVAPCGATCVTATDKLHTLRRTATISAGAASFTGSDSLLSGNVNNDAFVDIFDFGGFISQYNSNYGTGSTTCSTTSPHADFSGNGLVTIPDFSFIQINFLKSREANCCGLANLVGDGEPAESVSVKDLIAMGLIEMAAADLNRDGIVDQLDLAAFMAGVLPGHAASFTGRPGGSWFDAGNWSDGQVPDASADITIPVQVLIDQPGAIARSVTIPAGGALGIFAGSLTADQVIVQDGGLLLLDDPSAALSVTTLVIEQGATLDWNAGTIAGEIVSSGTVDLGAPAAPLVLAGGFTQTQTGLLKASLGDAPLLLQITGEASLAGTLQLALSEDFAPWMGDVYQVLTAGNVIGAFEIVEIPPLGDGMALHMGCAATSCSVTVGSAVFGDLNGDSLVGPADLAQLIASWGQCLPVTSCAADLDHDGQVGPADLAQLLAQWSP